MSKPNIKTTIFLIRLKELWPIMAILLFSLIARLYRLGANLPNTYWHDENNYVEMAMRFGTGNFQPDSIQHGMLLPIILFIEYSVYFLLQRLIGVLHSPTDFMNEYITNPSNIYFIGRLTVCLFAVAGIYLVYLISLRFFTKRSAILSSFIFSVSLVPFIQSKWTKAATLSAFFLLLALLMVAHLIENFRNSRRSLTIYYMLSGFFVGLAAAAKIYGIFGFSFILVAHIFSYDHRGQGKAGIIDYLLHCFNGNILLSALLLLAGFCLGNPYAAINPYFFYDNMRELNKELSSTAINNPWYIYLTVHLKDAVGSAMLTLLMLVSSIYFVIKRSKKELVLLAYPIVLYLYLALRDYSVFAHYMIPAVPFLAIVTGSFLDLSITKARSPSLRILIIIIFCIAVIPCVLNIFRYDMLISKPDTRTVAKYWVEYNIPNGSKILSEGCISAIPIQVPQLKSTTKALMRDLDFVRSNGGKGSLLNAEISRSKNDTKNKRYDIYKVKSVDVQDLEKVNADYVVLSGYVGMDTGEREYLISEDAMKRHQAALKFINQNYVLINQVSPYPELGPYFPLLLIDDFKKLESISLVKDQSRLMQGPEIRIYRRIK